MSLSHILRKIPHLNEMGILITVGKTVKMGDNEDWKIAKETGGLCNLGKSYKQFGQSKSGVNNKKCGEFNMADFV